MFIDLDTIFIFLAFLGPALWLSGLIEAMSGGGLKPMTPEQRARVLGHPAKCDVEGWIKPHHDY